jgi:hypothetical protein
VRELFERSGLLEVVDPDQIFGSNAAAVAAYAGRSGRTFDPHEVTAEAAVGLEELVRLSTSDEVRRRLQRAIDALESDDDR